MNLKTRDGVEDLRHYAPGVPGVVGVPRFCALPPDGGETDHTALGDETGLTFTGALRPYQIAPLNEALSRLRIFGGLVLEAQTGWGKAVGAAWLAASVRRTTCIVVPKGDLQDQMRDRLLGFTDARPEDVDVWRGQRLPDPRAKVVIAMLQSVYRGCYPAEVYNRFGLLIVDEMDVTGAPEFKAVLSRFPARYRVGMSATPERRDRMDGMIRAHLGTQRIVGYTDAAKPKVYWIETDWTPPGDADFDPSRGGYVKNSLYGDAIRNAAICGAALRAQRAGRRTIIFVDFVEHMTTLRDCLLSMGAPKGLVTIYGGPATKEDTALAHACPAGIIVVATRKMFGRGTDVPALDTCILAAPEYDPRQTVGRILRKLEGKKEPIVIDVIDRRSPTLVNMAKGRAKNLAVVGATYVKPWR